MINIVNNADYDLLDRILGNSDEIEEINSFSRKMYKRLDEYIKGHCVDGDIEDDELFGKLVNDWYLEKFVE